MDERPFELVSMLNKLASRIDYPIDEDDIRRADSILTALAEWGLFVDDDLFQYCRLRQRESDWTMDAIGGAGDEGTGFAARLVGDWLAVKAPGANGLVDGLAEIARLAEEELKADSFALTDSEIRILQLLEQASPRLVTNSAICNRERMGNTTVSTAMIKLARANLVVRPEGPRSGATITSNGKAALGTLMGR